MPGDCLCCLPSTHGLTRRERRALRTHRWLSLRALRLCWFCRLGHLRRSLRHSRTTLTAPTDRRRHSTSLWRIQRWAEWRTTYERRQVSIKAPPDNKGAFILETFPSSLVNFRSELQ